MIEFLNKNVVEDILIKSGFHQGIPSKAARLLNEHLSKVLPDVIEGLSALMCQQNDHDSGNRLFGVVNEVMEDLYDKNGYTLLVYETEPNFDVNKTKASKEEHDQAFKQWWSLAEGRNRFDYTLDEESTKFGYDLAIQINNI